MEKDFDLLMTCYATVAQNSLVKQAAGVPDMDETENLIHLGHVFNQESANHIHDDKGIQLLRIQF